jgi:hypothetical protein
MPSDVTMALRVLRSAIVFVPLVVFLAISVMSALTRAQYLQNLSPERRISPGVLGLFIALVPLAHCLGCVLWSYGSCVLASNYYDQPRLATWTASVNAIAAAHWPLVAWAGFVWYWSLTLDARFPSLDEFAALTRSAHWLELPSFWLTAGIAATRVAATTHLRPSAAVLCVLAPFGVLQLLSEALRPLLF